MSAADQTSSEQFPVMYHSTRVPIEGDRIYPMGGHRDTRAWASTDAEEAHRHAYRKGLVNGKDLPVRTYQVEPISSEGLEKGTANYVDRPADNYSTPKGFRVIQEVPTTEAADHWGRESVRNELVHFIQAHTFPNFDFSGSNDSVVKSLGVSSSHLENIRYRYDGNNDVSPEIDDYARDAEMSARVFKDKKYLSRPEASSKEKGILRRAGIDYAQTIKGLKDLKGVQPTELFTTIPARIQGR